MHCFPKAMLVPIIAASSYIFINDSLNQHNICMCHTCLTKQLYLIKYHLYLIKKIDNLTDSRLQFVFVYIYQVNLKMQLQHYSINTFFINHLVEERYIPSAAHMKCSTRSKLEMHQLQFSWPIPISDSFGGLTCRYRFLPIPIFFLRTIFDSIYKQKSMQMWTFLYIYN